MLGLRRKTASTEEPPPSPAAIHADLAGATVSGQVAIGEHIVQIQAGPGARVTYTAPDARPEIRRRSVPVRRLPRDFPGLLGRDAEVAAVGDCPRSRRLVDRGLGPARDRQDRAASPRRAPRRPPCARGDRCSPPAAGNPLEDVLQFVFESLLRERHRLRAHRGPARRPPRRAARARRARRRASSRREDLEAGPDGRRAAVAVPHRRDRPPALGRGPRGEPGRARDVGGARAGSSASSAGAGSNRSGGPAAEAFCRAVGGHPLRLLQGAAA